MKNKQNSSDSTKYFKTAQNKFYREIGKETININKIPYIEELKTF